MYDCQRCFRTPEKDGITLHRISPIGETPVIWWCNICCHEEGIPIDSVTLEVTKAILDYNETVKRSKKNVAKNKN